jgi:hypothetical protein
VLDIFPVTEGLVQAYGFSFVPTGQDRIFPSEVLTAKILCKGHNEALSPLDERMRAFVETFNRYATGLASGPLPPSSLALTNGNDIEYWLLKTMCGLACSGVVRGLASRGLNPIWLEILMKGQTWPRDWGLYVPGERRPDLRWSEPGLFTRLAIDSEGVPAQLGVQLQGATLVLHASDSIPPPKGWLYRPHLLVLEKKPFSLDLERSVSLGMALSYSPSHLGGVHVATVHDAPEPPHAFKKHTSYWRNAR